MSPLYRRYIQTLLSSGPRVCVETEKIVDCLIPGLPELGINWRSLCTVFRAIHILFFFSTGSSSCETYFNALRPYNIGTSTCTSELCLLMASVWWWEKCIFCIVCKSVTMQHLQSSPMPVGCQLFSFSITVSKQPLVAISYIPFNENQTFFGVLGFFGFIHQVSSLPCYLCRILSLSFY